MKYMCDPFIIMLTWRNKLEFLSIWTIYRDHSYRVYIKKSLSNKHE